MISEARQELLEIIKKRALSFGEVTLSSGKKSNYYIDGRLVTLSPKGAYLTATLLFDLLKDDDFDAIGGPTLGADPILGAFAALSFERGKPINTFIVRKEAKTHGKQKEIEGPLEKNFKVVIVDDVVTTGDSILRAIETVKNFGCQVVRVVALVDRSENASQRLLSQGYKLDTLFTPKDLGV